MPVTKWVENLLSLQLHQKIILYHHLHLMSSGLGVLRITHQESGNGLMDQCGHILVGYQILRNHLEMVHSLFQILVELEIGGIGMIDLTKLIVPLYVRHR